MRDMGPVLYENYINFRFTITDYFELTLYKKRYSEKKKYLSSKDNLYFSEYVDDKRRLKELCSKTEMYQLLKPYIKREQLYSQECTYDEFCYILQTNTPDYYINQILLIAVAALKSGI